ncbi:armadillo repeat-containing protein 5-like [Branchiostoma floridae]|uniref:Armadillo repeat-containing protein 5-like n=1 Tax=Branchiostoma floridae TaxID=7739 RepID=A0A9J7LZ02_BRAFL|nr:armadillo repeat-containing protein 5-like [Branchiostoma floridae]
MATVENDPVSQAIWQLKRGTNNVVYSSLVKIRTECIKREGGVSKFRELGGIQALILQIQRPNPKIADVALSILANCCMEGETRREVRKTRGLSPLVNLLKVLKSDSLLNRASRAIANLALDVTNAQVIHSLKGVPALIDVLNNTESSECRQSVVRAVRNLADTEEHRDEVIRCEGLQAVVELLKLDDVPLVTQAVRTVTQLTKNCTFECARQVSEGTGISSLVELASHVKPVIKKEALLSLVNLTSHGSIRPDIGNAGGIQVFVREIKASQDISNVLPLVNALCLCCREAINRLRVRELKGLELLVSLLKSPSCKDVHERLVGTFLCFFYDEPSLEVLRGEGLIPLLMAKLLDSVSVSSTDEDLRDSGKSAPSSAWFSASCDFPTEFNRFPDPLTPSNKASSFVSMQTWLQQQPEYSSELGQLSPGSASPQWSPASSTVSCSDSSDGNEEPAPRVFSPQIHWTEEDETLPEREEDESESNSEGVEDAAQLEPSTSVDTSMQEPPCSPVSVSEDGPESTTFHPIRTDACSDYSPSSPPRKRRRPSSSPGPRLQPGSRSPQASGSPPAREFRRDETTESVTGDVVPGSPVGLIPLTTDHMMNPSSLSCAPLVIRVEEPKDMEHNILLLLSRYSQMVDPSGCLVTKQCVNGLVDYIHSAPHPNPRCTRILNRLTCNPNCFEAFITAHALHKIHNTLMATSTHTHHSDQSVTVAEDTSGETVCKDNTIVEDKEDQDMNEPSSVCSTPRKQKTEDSTGDGRSESQYGVGLSLLRNLSVQAESSYGNGILTHLLSTVTDVERTACALALPYLCRSRALRTKMLIEERGLQRLVDIVQNSKDELLSLAVDSVVMVMSGWDKRDQDNSDIEAEGSDLKEDSTTDIETLGSTSEVTKAVESVHIQTGTPECRYETLSDRHDVVFRLEDKSAVSGCRRVIAEKSAVFAAMLEGHYSESAQSEVNITGVSHDAFLYLVHFIHGCRHNDCTAMTTICIKEGDSVETSQPEQPVGLEILAVANKYLLPTLQDSMADVMLQQTLYISPGSVLKLYLYAVHHRCERLVEHCVRFLTCGKMSREERVKCFRDLADCGEEKPAFHKLEEILKAYV